MIPYLSRSLTYPVFVTTSVNFANVILTRQYPIHGISIYWTWSRRFNYKAGAGVRGEGVPLYCCRRRWISAAYHPDPAAPPNTRSIGTGSECRGVWRCALYSRRRRFVNYSAHPSNSDRKLAEYWPLWVLKPPVHVENAWQIRNIFSTALENIHPAILAPVVFCGLVVTLWTYKCLMMIIFQNKIIYMPGVPLGARKETLQDYESLCSGIQWKEVKIPTQDGNLLGGAIAEVRVQIKDHVNRLRLEDSQATGVLRRKVSGNRKRVVVVYLQGNASSTPPRLPMLSTILRRLSGDSRSHCGTPYSEVIYTIIAPSYRGYWNSTGSPSQRGIEKDGQAIFKFLDNRGYHVREFSDTAGNTESNSVVVHQDPDEIHSDELVETIIWGQSIGANIAVTILANYLQTQGNCVGDSTGLPSHALPPPAALILETPFFSIPDMLVELYPQKWLPYRYLTPFLRNWWDLESALAILARRGFWPGKILILTAGKDELVGSIQSAKVELALKTYMAGCKVDDQRVGERTRNVVVKGALHVECLSKNQGQREVIDLIKEIGVGKLGKS